MSLTLPDENPYTVLGLEPGASIREIKKAYFQQVRAHPPEADPEAFSRIRTAYDHLRTPEKRLETNMLMVQALPKPKFPSLFKAPKFIVAVEDAIQAARAFSDLARTDFREDFREVSL